MSSAIGFNLAQSKILLSGNGLNRYVHESRRRLGMGSWHIQTMKISMFVGGIAGGQTVTLTGLGFNGMSSATICTGTCTLVSHTTTQYVCKTPANSGEYKDAFFFHLFHLHSLAV